MYENIVLSNDLIRALALDFYDVTVTLIKAEEEAEHIQAETVEEKQDRES